MILKIIFAVLGVFLLINFYFSFKYRNPHKYYFIFGKKGSGKSCLMVHEMMKFINRGWTIYTDMPVNIPNVRIIKDANELFKLYTPEPHSAIFLDEIGLTWHSRNFKSFDGRIREWFKLQRKYKCMVYCNSQVWDIDKGLRDLNDRLILQENIGNWLSVSKPIIRKTGLVEATAEGESRIADQLRFASIFQWKFYFMPKYFKYFNSFEAPYRPLMPYDKVQTEMSYKELRKYGFNKKTAKSIASQYEVIQDEGTAGL